ncbi:phage distal tail protein [Melissospora conviva]|uniref:phage distal tail protein n=1 Tax=Melissospora conviva TaxID=3388432 RepID=UPI003C1D96FF
MTEPAHVGEYVPTWIGPDGDEWELNPPGTDLFTINEVSGYGITPVELVAEPDARGGDRIRRVRPQARVLTWPVRIRDTTHMRFLTRWRQLAESFAATHHRGPGLFRLTRPDGSAREILAYYQSGWDGEPRQGHTEDTPVLSLLCPDPYWRDTEPTILDRRYSEQVDFLAPYPNLSSGDVLGDTELTNPGAVETWPEWTITGPATQVVATNHTVGHTFTVNHTLAAGQQIRITTRPGRVIGPDGSPLAGALARPGSTLWRMTSGSNLITFAVTGGGPGTCIRVAFRARYSTA